MSLKGIQNFIYPITVLSLAGLIFFYIKYKHVSEDNLKVKNDLLMVNDSFFTLKKVLYSEDAYVNAFPIERDHADLWVNAYVNSHTNSLQRVVFDLEKLSRAVNGWENLRGQNKPVNAVAAQLISYDENIFDNRYGVNQSDPGNRKVPGAISILLSPWDTIANRYYYDSRLAITKPINLGDLHP